MAGGPGGDIAVSPGCQEAEQRSIGVADLTAKKIGLIGGRPALFEGGGCGRELVLVLAQPQGT